MDFSWIADQISKNIFDAINAGAQLILAVTAITALVYAIRQYGLTRNRFVEDSRPYISVELEPVTSGLFNLAVRNSGNSSAKNIHIKFTPNIALFEYSKTKINSYKFLKNLKYLASDKSLTFYFGSVIGGKTIISREFKIEINYEDVEGRKYNDSLTIDPRDYLEMSSISRKGIHDIGKSIEEIAKEFKKANTGGNNLINQLEKGLILRDSRFNDLSIDELKTTLTNLLTVGIEDVHNTYPMIRDSELIAKLLRDKLLMQKRMTKPQTELVKVLNRFESSEFDYKTDEIVNDALKILDSK